MAVLLNQESPQIFTTFKKEDLCVAQLFNGMLIMGEDKGDKIENPITFSFEQQFAEYDEYGVGKGTPTGVGFRSYPIGEPVISRKVNALEGIPEIKKFILNPIAKSNCMVCNNLKDIEIGGHLLAMYSDVMTKVASPMANMKEQAKSPIIQ